MSFSKDTEKNSDIDLTFNPQEPRSIGSQLHRHLRSAIIRGEFAPGHALSESEMSKRYAVSRQPIREAFIKLAEEHLVSIVPQRGTFVMKISMQDVLDAQFMREALEVAIVREAAAKAQADDIQMLNDILAQQIALSLSDHQGFWLLDEAFHQGIAKTAGRQSTWSILESIKSQMDRVRYLSIEDATPTLLLIEHHQHIVNAIAQHDVDAADKAIRRHVREILTSLPRVAAAYPAFFDMT